MSRSAISLHISLCAMAMLALAGTAHAERADRDKPIHMEANRVVMDDARQVTSFEGRVQLTQGTVLIQADKIVVKEDAQGYQHLTATGNPARFRQRYEGSNDYAEGDGERIEYDTRAETVDFFGQARVKRGLNEVSGAQITYSTKTEVFEVQGKTTPGTEATSTDSRVRAVIQPKSKPADETTSGQETLIIQPSSTLSPSKPVPPNHE